MSKKDNSYSKEDIKKCVTIISECMEINNIPKNIIFRSICHLFAGASYYMDEETLEYMLKDLKELCDFYRNTPEGKV